MSDPQSDEVLSAARLSAEAPAVPQLEPWMTLEAHYTLLPTVLKLPASEEAWSGAYGDPPSIPLPDAVYACTELSGNSLLDHLHPDISGRALSPVNRPVQGRRAVGLRATDRDGQVVVHPARGVECTADNQMFQAQDTGWANPGSRAFAMMVVYRVIRVSGEASRGIAGKRTATGHGYAFGVDYSSGLGRFLIEDGLGANNSAWTENPVDDGAWHCSLLVIREYWGNLRATHYNDVGNPGVGQITGLPSLDTDAAFRIGQDGEWPAARCQVAYLAIWQFDQADPDYGCFLDGSAHATFWTAGKPEANQVDPPGDVPDYKSHTTVAWMVGSNPYGTGNVVAKYGDEQYRYAAIGDAAVDKGGYAANREMDNYLSHTEQFLSPWSKTGGGSVQTNAADAPDGMHGAARVTYDGNGTLSYTVSSTASCTASVWVRVESCTDQNAKVELGGTADYEQIPITNLLHGRWTRIAHVYSSESSDTTVEIRVTNNDSETVVLDLWGAQLELRGYPGAYVPAWESPSSAQFSMLQVIWTPPPPTVGDEARMLIKARFPFPPDQAEDMAIIAMSQDEPMWYVALWRMAYGGEHGRIVLDISNEFGPWAMVVSTISTGLQPGQTAEDAEEVRIEFGWRFDANPEAWLEVNGIPGEVVLGPGDPFSGFMPYGAVFAIDIMATDVLDAPLSDFWVWALN